MNSIFSEKYHNLTNSSALDKKEYSEDRKGNQALDMEYSGPINLPNNLGQNNLLFMDYKILDINNA